MSGLYMETPKFLHVGQIDHDICDNLIDFFEEYPMGDVEYKTKKYGTFRGTKTAGKASANGVPFIDKKIKVSTDLAVPHHAEDERIQNYQQALGKILDEYETKYPWVSKKCQEWGSAPWDFFNIQKYEPGEGFYAWHSERCTMARRIITRYLVFMTYLNDVKDGGGTEWYHQKYQTQAVKGATVIWPPDWTFTHRGIVSPTETKYIATGWFNFLPKNFDKDYVTPVEIKDQKGYFYSADTFLTFGRRPNTEED